MLEKIPTLLTAVVKWVLFSHYRTCTQRNVWSNGTVEMLWKSKTVRGRFGGDVDGWMDGCGDSP